MCVLGKSVSAVLKFFKFLLLFLSFKASQRLLFHAHDEFPGGEDVLCLVADQPQVRWEERARWGGGRPGRKNRCEDKR